MLLIQEVQTLDNKDGILKTIVALKEDKHGLIFTNLVDFDMLYGHRRNVKGYKNALEEFDSYMPEILANLKRKRNSYYNCRPRL